MVVSKCRPVVQPAGQGAPQPLARVNVSSQSRLNNQLAFPPGGGNPVCAIKTNVTVAPRPDAYRRQLSAGAQHGAIFPDTFVDDGCFVDERNRDQHLFYFFRL